MSNPDGSAEQEQLWIRTFHRTHDVPGRLEERQHGCRNDGTLTASWRPIGRGLQAMLGWLKRSKDYRAEELHVTA